MKLANLLLVKHRLIALLWRRTGRVASRGHDTLNTRNNGWLAWAAATMAIASPACAQVYTSGSAAGVAETRTSGLSPSALDTDVLPGFTGELDASYDSNVARRQTSFGPRPIEPHDEIFRPSLLMNVEKAIGRESLFLTGSAGYDFYRQNSFLNRENIRLEGGGSAPVGPCKTTLSGAFARYQTDLANLAVIVPNAESHETVAAEGDCAQVIGVSPELTVTQSWVQNSAIVEKPLDRREFAVSGGLNYDRPALGQVSVFGSYQHAIFPYSFGVAGLGSQPYGYNAYSGGVRYTRQLGARIQGVVSIQYQDLQAIVPGASGFKGVAYSADVTYRASGKLQTRFVFSRQNVPSDRVGATFVTEDVYSGNASYQVGARMKLILGVSRRDDSYGALAVGAPLLFAQNESVTEVDGALNYDMSRKITLALYAKHETRDTEVALYNYSSTRVGLQLLAKF
jgi:hypothetical protein